MAVSIHTIETTGLGDRSYLVHDGTTAFVVDPPRDIDRIVSLAADRGISIAQIFETHVHNDYVSGSLALSRRTGSEIVTHVDADLSFATRQVADGDTVAVGAMTVEARHSPGHTHDHMCYVVHFDGSINAVFTGGSLLYGTVGRTDLLGDEHTLQLTRDQWTSVRTLVGRLPDEVAVYPTHGFGSFCSAKPGADRDEGTIGDEHDNPAVATEDVDEFVADLLAGLTDIPSYYAHMAHLNRAGAAEPDLSPAAQISIDEVRTRLEDSEWVIDLRGRHSYAEHHLEGTINFEVDGLPTHLGWLVPWASRLTLLAADRDTIASGQRRLARIGIDRPSQADFRQASETLPTGQYAVATFAELARIRTADRTFSVIDVRRQDEYENNHLDGAINIALHDLLDNLDRVPEGSLWVHCASGARASIASSLLARAGFDVTLVDGGPDDE